MTQNYRYPSILQSVWILILLNILQWVLSRFRDILRRVMISRASITGILLLHHPSVSSLISVIPYGLILFRGLKRANTSFREICPFAPVRLPLLFPMALTVIGVFMLLFEINYWLAILLPWSEWYTEYLLRRTQVNYWNSVDLVIIAPLTEELLVRGLILRGFLSRYSVRKAILASALFFGLMHLFPWNFTGSTISGILFAWWFIETRSMLPCFFGHALFNALVLVYGAPVQPDMGFRYHPFWWNVVGVILTALGIWFLIRQFRKSSDVEQSDPQQRPCEEEPQKT